MMTDAPDRVSIYHTANTGDPPAWALASGTKLRAKVSSMSNDQVLAANAEGIHDYRVTHRVRVEYTTAAVYRALIKREVDGKCFLILNVQESNYRRYDKPDHLICDCAVLPSGTA